MQSEKARNIISQSIENNNYITIKIGHKSISTLLDTGSGSTMNERVARELRLTINPSCKGDSRRLLTASGTLLYVVKSCDLNINISGLIVPYNVLIVRNLQESLILGSDFLSKNDVIIDYRLKTVSIADDLVRLPLHVSGDGQSYVYQCKKTYHFITQCKGVICHPFTAIIIVFEPVKYISPNVSLQDDLLTFTSQLRTGKPSVFAIQVWHIAYCGPTKSRPEPPGAVRTPPGAVRTPPGAARSRPDIVRRPTPPGAVQRMPHQTGGKCPRIRLQLGDVNISKL